jgi:hypothetical protein
VVALGDSASVRKALAFVVGVTGFEPATPTSRMKSDASQALPSNDKLYYVKCRKSLYFSAPTYLSLLVMTGYLRIS